MDTHELVVAFVAVRFIAEAEVYPVWEAYNQMVLGSSFPDEKLPPTPSRTELTEVATKLMKQALVALPEDEKAEVIRLLKERL